MQIYSTNFEEAEKIVFEFANEYLKIIFRLLSFKPKVESLSKFSNTVRCLLFVYDCNCKKKCVFLECYRKNGGSRMRNSKEKWQDALENPRKNVSDKRIPIIIKLLN